MEIKNGYPHLSLAERDRRWGAIRAKMVESDAYRVVIEGSPNIEQETTVRGRYDGDPNSGGCLSTGMRAIHAIPAVRAAKPGLLSALDLPLIPGKGNMR